MPDAKPIDTLLFDAIHIHSMRTRGQPASLVTLRYADGTETTLSLPGRDLPDPPDLIAIVSWPPSDGWAFRPGEGAFNGQRFRIAGKLLAILRILAARPGEPVTCDKLKREVWGEEPEYVEDGNLHGHLSMLRKRLKDSLGLIDVNPIAHADGAYRLALH